MNFVALDFETANNSPTSICQIGLSVFENGKVVENKSFYVKPYPYYFASSNIAVHGIDYSVVANMPTFPQYWQHIMHYFDNRIMIAHNASFDFKVLYKSLTYFGLEMPTIEFYCTLLISKRLLKGYPSYSLHNLCSNFGIDFTHHDAAEDAQAAGLLMLQILQKNQFYSIKELAQNYNFKKGIINPTTFLNFSTKK